MIDANQRHEIAVTFYPTRNHTLTECIIAAGFYDSSDDGGYSVIHNATGMEYIYPHGAIHPPRDDGNGIKYVYSPQ